MNFAGTGKRLEQGDVGNAARELGVETAVLLTFIEVEANGRGFDRKKRPKMLFEPHVFWRNLKGAKKSQAERAGLAYRDRKSGNYPRDSYPRLAAAIKIVEETAYRSASYGLPQILGENHKAAGFASAKAMFSAMKQGEREQLLAMVSLLKDWGLAKHLKGKDFSKPESWVRAVKRYNGSGFRKHGYHIRCAKAYIKHNKGDLSVSGQVNILIHGMKGEAVRNLQSDLDALGYDLGPIDGRYGDKTLDAVKAFQARAKLTVDGKAGPKTQGALEKDVQALHGEQALTPTTGPSRSPLALLFDILTSIILAIFGKARP